MNAHEIVLQETFYIIIEENEALSQVKAPFQKWALNLRITPIFHHVRK